MNRYRITITLNSAVCLSSGPALGNEIYTLRYIPGSTVRGVLAAAALQNGISKSDFSTLFSEEGLMFGDCCRNQVLPLSAMSCKHFSGFTGEGKEYPPHGVVDMLFKSLDPAIKSVCPKCGAPLKALEATEYTREGSRFKTEEIPVELHTRTAVGGGGSARNGALFTQEEIPAGFSFQGWIQGNEEKIDALRKSIALQTGGNITINIGKRRSGSAGFSIDLPLSFEPVSSCVWKGQQGLWLAAKMESDTILVDRLLKPVIALDAASVVELMGAPSDAVVKEAFISFRKISGWSQVGQMFKPDFYAIGRGSTFLLNFPHSPQKQLEAWAKDVEFYGVGLRRTEGFGQVSFRDPLHRTVLEANRAGVR
jgi:CRISPR-associated protein Csx10